MAELHEPDSPDVWDNFLRRNVKKADNHLMTNIVIVSPQAELVKDYVETKLRIDAARDKMTFKVFDMLKENICDNTGVVIDKDMFVKKLRDLIPRHIPTYILLAYRHGLIFDQFPSRYFYSQPKPNTVPLVLKENGFLGSILDGNDTAMFISTPTGDVYKLENCVLACTGEATEGGMIKSLIHDVLEEGKLENNEQTRVMVLTGGHGSMNKDGNKKPVGGNSCFTQLDLLEYRFYTEMSEAFGVAAGPDLCKYDDDKTVIDIMPSTTPPVPQPMALVNWPSSRKQPLLQDSRFNLMKFNVLNIACFFNNADGLIEYLNKFAPTFLIIDWCFASFGDLSVTLRAKGFFSKMLLEMDLKTMSKNKNARISYSQSEVLKKTQNDDYKLFILGGGSGSGKTLLGAEMTKTLIAKLTAKNDKPVEVRVLTCVNGKKKPKELLKKLSEVYFHGMESFLKEEHFLLFGSDDEETISDHGMKIKLLEIIDAIGDKLIVIFMDEASIVTENLSFIKFHGFPANVYIVCCISPTQGKWGDKLYNYDDLRLPIHPDTSYDVLTTCYRNNLDIQRFIQFWVQNKMKSEAYILSESTTGTPEPLPGSSYPVVWLDCAEDMMQEQYEQILLEMKISVQKRWKDCSVEGIVTGYGVPNYINSENCAGIEAEIILVVDSGFGYSDMYTYETVSRAHRQLYYLTTNNTARGVENTLKKAVNEKVLEKRQVTLEDLMSGGWIGMAGERGPGGFCYIL